MIKNMIKNIMNKYKTITTIYYIYNIIYIIVAYIVKNVYRNIQR
jgi:hypothetical protein